MAFISLSDPKITAPYLSAIDCTLDGGKAIYCSSELTSGRRLYNALRARGVTSEDELKERLGKELYKEWRQKNVVNVNNSWASKFATFVRHSQNDGTLVINPGPLSDPRWGQDEYLAFWEELIRTRVTEVRFNQNWQFSNGCTFEFAVALDASIPTLDSHEYELGADEAVESVEKAAAKLEGEGFSIPKLRANLDRLRSLTNLLPANHARPLPDRTNGNGNGLSAR
jgi:hypothetical protein